MQFVAKYRNANGVDFTAHPVEQSRILTAKPVEVFHLDGGQEVHCYYCLQQHNLTLYKRGEAFFAGAGHSPCGGNANFICERHLDDDAVVYEPAA